MKSLQDTAYTRQHHRVSDGVRLLVCLSVFPHDISKTDAARITKLDTQMSHNECWKPVHFGGGVKSSKVKVTSHKNSAGVSLCTLVSAGFF